MNLKKPNLKSRLSAVKNNAKKKGAAAKKRKNVPFHGYSNQKENPALHREGKLVVPIGFQTVLAVVVCCVVLIVAGFGFYGAQQIEIQNLKNELKAYVADGLVPAGSMDSSVTLNIEAVGGRVTNLRKMMDQATEGTLTNEELLWIGTELNAVHAESRILNDILNSIEADKNVRNAYADNIQGPIVVLQETYATLAVPGSVSEGEGDSTGAAGDTGAFKSSGNMEKGIRWAVVIIVVVALVLGAFLLRRKLSAMILRHHKDDGKAPAKGSGNRKHQGKKGTAKAAAAAKNGKTTHVHPFAGEDIDEAPAAPPVTEEADAAAETANTAEAAPEEELSEEEAFLAEVAALQRMAEAERKKAENGSAMIAPAPEDLIAFDASVATQDAIEDEDDPLFRKNDNAE